MAEDSDKKTRHVVATNQAVFMEEKPDQPNGEERASSESQRNLTTLRKRALRRALEEVAAKGKA